MYLIFYTSDHPNAMVHRVRRHREYVQNYPNMLIEVSLNDSQVPYWEGAKLGAKIREMKTDKNIVMVKVNMGAGHGGSSGRYDRLKEVAFDYAYALSQVGITK